MSVYFRSIPASPFDELMDGQLEFYNIHVVISEEATGLQGPDGFVHVRGEKGQRLQFCDLLLVRGDTLGSDERHQGRFFRSNS
jgi:hypothetical protein